MRFFSFLVALLAYAEGWSQTVSGRVFDKESGIPLVYVSIGVPIRNMGTISREGGEFEINLSGIPKNEKLVFSMVGYTTVSVNIDSISESDLIVSLVPSIIQLKEVVILEKPLIELVKLGLPEATKMTIGHSGNHEWGTGTEWGLRIPNEGELFELHKVGFHTRFNTVDSILFRINIYSGADSLPGSTLLHHGVFVKSYSGDKWIVRSIKDERIVIDSDIIVTIEILRIWYRKFSDNQLFFTYGMNKNNLLSYSRQSSQDRWRVNEMPPLALYVLARKLN